jgi:uncharacterized protein
MKTGIYSVVNTVVKWAKKFNVREIIVLAGIAMEESVLKNSNRKPMILCNDGKISDNGGFIRAMNTCNNDDTHEATLLTGIPGGLLASCLSNRIACSSLILGTLANIPDPEGAAILIESLNGLGNNLLKLDVQPLRQWAESIRQQMEQIAKTMHRQQQQRSTESKEMVDFYA